MSINDQVAGWENQSRFAMREDTIDRNSQQVSLRHDFRNRARFLRSFSGVFL